MKRILIGLFFCTTFLFAQGTPNCSQAHTFTTVTTGPVINTTAGASAGCAGWRLTWQVSGSITGATIQLEGSQDNSSWAAFDSSLVLEGSNPTNWTAATLSNTIVVRGSLPYVRVNVTGMTGSGAIKSTLLGYSGTSAQLDIGGGGGGSPTGPAGGDLYGNYPNPRVGGLAAVPFCNGFAPIIGQLLVYSTYSTPNPCYQATSELISASTFGCAGDGMTDNTNCLLALGAYALAHDGTTILFPPGTYAYTLMTGRGWLAKVQNVTIWAYGAHLVSSSPPSSGHYTIFGQFGDPHMSGTTGYAISTVASGANTVTTVTPADAGNFGAGNDVLLNGWDQQMCFGGPQNAKYFEYAQVASSDVSTGVVALTAPIKNGYDSRWHSCGPAYPYLAGPGNILSLSSPVYQISHTIRVFGMDFTSGTAPTAQADVYATDSLYFLLQDCKIDWFVPSSSEVVEVQGGNIGGMEGDKLVDRVLMNNVNFLGTDGIGTCTGCDSVTISNSVIHQSGINFEARNTTFLKNTIVADTTLYTLIGCNLTWSGKRCELDGNRFSNLLVGSLVTAGNGLPTVTALASPAPTATSISVAYDGVSGNNPGFASQGDIGAILKLQGGNKWGRVTGYYDNGTTMTLTATFNATPVAGEVYEYHILQTLAIGANNSYDDVSYPTDDFGPYNYGWINAGGFPLEPYGISDVAVIGGIENNVKAVPGPPTGPFYHVTRRDGIVNCNASGADASGFSVTLPNPTDNAANPPYGPLPGQKVTVKKVDASLFPCVVNGNGANIDFAGTQTLSTQGASITVEWDYLSGQYWIVGSH